MAMLKGLRKHNKWILVVGGSLLMIAWLMPQGIKQLGPSRQGPVQGTIDGRKVRQVEFAHNAAELRAVRFLIPTVIDGLLESSSRDQTAHWLLLTTEAEEAGFVGGPQDGADWLQEIAPELAYQELRSRFQQLDDQMFRQYILPGSQQQLQQQTDQIREIFKGIGIQQAGSESRLTADEVLMAVAKARGIFRMKVAYLSAPRASDRAAIIKGRRWVDRATTDAVFIPADLLLSSVADPTEDELAAHFAAYRDTIPGTGKFGVGYLQPPRIKYEYMKLDRAAIRQAVVLDPVATYKEWQTNRATYKGEFADEKTKVEDRLRDRRADDVMQAATQIVRAEVFKTVKRLEQEGNYRKLSQDWDSLRPRFEAVAQAVQAQVAETTGVKIPLPTVVIRDARWQTLDDLAADPDLSSAHIRYASREYPLAQSQNQAPVIFQVRELGFETPLALQTGIPVVEYPAEDAARNLYFFTVLAARQESAPDSIDEVRDQAVIDCKRIKAYEALAARADEFRQAAIAGGLDAVINSFRSPDAPEMEAKLPTIMRSVSVSRVGGGAQQLSNDAFRTAVMDAAAGIDPLADPATYDPAAATVVVLVPDRLGVGVARITRLRPLTWEDYRQVIEGSLSADIRREVGSAVAISPFSFQATAARHGWVQRISDDEEEAHPAAKTDDGKAPAPPSKG